MFKLHVECSDLGYFVSTLFFIHVQLEVPTHHLLGNHCLALPREILLERLCMPAPFYRIDLHPGWALVMTYTFTNAWLWPYTILHCLIGRPEVSMSSQLTRDRKLKVLLDAEIEQSIYAPGSTHQSVIVFLHVSLHLCILTWKELLWECIALKKAVREGYTYEPCWRTSCKNDQLLSQSCAISDSTNWPRCLYIFTFII